MIEFTPYNIHIVYSMENQLFMEKQLVRYAMFDDPWFFNWTDETGRHIADVRPDRPSAASRRYESTISHLLQRVASTKIGSILLQSIPPHWKVFIVPLTRLEKKGCGCSAQTVWWQMSAKAGGGSRIEFTPEFNQSGNLEATLVHELVHAYRGNSKPRARQRLGSGWEYDNGEEFLAHQVQKVYMSASGVKRLPFVYGATLDPLTQEVRSEYGSKSSIYQYMVDHFDEDLKAVKYFLSSEPLCAKLATYKGADYNPFRDYKILERLAIESVERIHKMSRADIYKAWPWLAAQSVNTYRS